LYYESWYHLWCSGSTNEFFVHFILRNLGGIYLFREWEYISFNSIVRIIDQIVKTSSSGYNKIPLEHIVRENPSLISSGNNFWPDFPNSATKLWTTGSFFPENQGTNAKKKIFEHNKRFVSLVHVRRDPFTTDLSRGYWLMRLC
jgi:hypothetical protein